MEASVPVSAEPLSRPGAAGSSERPRRAAAHNKPSHT